MSIDTVEQQLEDLRRRIERIEWEAERLAAANAYAAVVAARDDDEPRLTAGAAEVHRLVVDLVGKRRGRPSATIAIPPWLDVHGDSDARLAWNALHAYAPASEALPPERAVELTRTRNEALASVAPQRVRRALDGRVVPIDTREWPPVGTAEDLARDTARIEALAERRALPRGRPTRSDFAAFAAFLHAAGMSYRQLAEIVLSANTSWSPPPLDVRDDELVLADALRKGIAREIARERSGQNPKTLGGGGERPYRGSERKGFR